MFVNHENVPRHRCRTQQTDLVYASDDLQTESLDDTNMSVTNHNHTHIYIVPLRGCFRAATPTVVNSCNECYNSTHDNTGNKTK